MKPGDFVYDLECFPNLFIAGFKTLTENGSGPGYIFELSDRRNDADELIKFITRCARMFGFNNMSYDWPMLDYFLSLLSRQTYVTAANMWEKNQQLFSAGFQNRFANIIWRPLIPQVDMFMMHHMDRFNVGLKQTEFNMRSRSVMDMPIAPGTVVCLDQIDTIISYNVHDINETEKLVLRSADDIKFRESLGPEWLNYNDGKIGKKFFENELKTAGVQLYQDGRKRSTPREEGVRLADVILPFIKFTRGDLQVALERFRDEHIFKLEVQEGVKKKERMLRADLSEVKYVFPLDDFNIDVKLGGIHGSLEKQAVYNDANSRILDFDVTSYYPSIAIVHRFYPLHLGPTFCDVYGRLKARRVALPKDHPDRGTLKFALNVPFGDSNNRHGIFFDPAYMLAITINGQLMLCMLAEQLANAGVKLIQVNTDGVTIKVPRNKEQIVEDIMVWWQRLTGMDLEKSEYSRMFIRDANNYIAESIGGKRKRKGAYEYKKNWRQDHSGVIVAKAAEAAMLDDRDPEDFIRNHPDPWDFLLFRKGNMELTTGEKLPRNIRYYISSRGAGLLAIHPPLKGKLTAVGRQQTDVRRIGIHAEGLARVVGTRPHYRCSECGLPFATKGAFDDHNKRVHSWKITLANVFDGQMPDDLDFRYYVKEAEKLIID